jgi:hypothetical protein
VLRSVLAFFTVLLGTVAVQAVHAQTNSGSGSNATAYLFRMERMRRAEDVCVLVRGDGQYHLERLFADRTDIFEGSLPPAELQELLRILDSDELFQLRQEKIETPLISSDFDELLVGVLRPEHWQNLRFPAPESRKPYQPLLNPLLK